MREVPFGLEWLPREIETGRTRITGNQADLTVFLGIFNAAAFMGDLLRSIRNQSWTSSLNLLIVDNNSTDDSLQILLDALPEMDGNITVVRNVTNVGALGSLYRNADLIETEWLTFMHQDDVYLPNFLDSCLREARRASDAPVSTISFDYRTVEGASASAHSPNPTWFAKGTPGYVAFQESLANQSIPWPCTVFRVEYLLENPVPFHSSAFLDTEIALNQVNFGENKYIPEVVMNYRVHGESGSHSLPVAEGEVLRCSSMLRVFNSQDFRSLVRSVPLNEQEEWATSLVQSALNYVNSQPLKDLLVASLLESMVLALEYRSSAVNKFLASELSRIGAAGAGALVKGLINGGSDSSSSSDLGPIAEPNRPTSPLGHGQVFLRKLALKLPKSLVLIIFRLVPKRLVPHPWSSYK
jgi:glycosyltransferase involved in cell wall biosynthesis